MFLSGPALALPPWPFVHGRRRSCCAPVTIALLLAQLAAILVVGRALAWVLRRLGQPGVIAEIVAGIALGPSLLGWLAPGGMATLFPPPSLPALSIVAQLGLVFFMFLVGLEFDPKLLQGQARVSVVISTAGIAVPFVLGALLAVPLSAGFAPEGVSTLSLALFLGTAMSVTAFPVLARILTERRLLRTRVGAIALASAAVNDVVAWCLLALVVGVVGSRGVGAALGTTALTLGYCAVIWFVVRPVLARLGPREGAQVNTDVIAAVFVLIAASALVTEVIGVHAIFGAFLLGAAMPRGGGLVSVLVEKVEDLVTVVLLPLFFAYSGLRTEIGLVSGTGDWIACGAIVAVATLGKFGGTALAARFVGLPRRDATALGVLMNTRGLMELVVLNVGLDMGVIDQRLFAMMVVMALVTTWITSPILARLYPPERTWAEARPEDTLRRPAADAVLICLSDPGAAATLVRLAAGLQRGGAAKRVLALHLRPTERPSDYLRGSQPEDGPLAAVAAAAESEALHVVPLAFPSATPAEDIRRVAASRGASIVLIGAHRPTVGTSVLGGLAGEIARAVEADVAIVVDRLTRAPRTVAAAADVLDPASTRVLDALVVSGLQKVARDAEDIDLWVAPWDAPVELSSLPGSIVVVHPGRVA